MVMVLIILLTRIFCHLSPPVPLETGESEISLFGPPNVMLAYLTFIQLTRNIFLAHKCDGLLD